MTSIECHPSASLESREQNYQTEPVNATATTATTDAMYPKIESPSDVISISPTDWVTIDDSRGIWIDSQQITHDMEERRQASSASIINQYYDEDGLRDWHDDLTSIINNKRLEFDTDEFSHDDDTTASDSITGDNSSKNCCKLAQDPEIAQTQLAISSRSPISPPPSLLRRTTSGSLWTGIKADSDQEIEAFVYENADDDDGWKERKIGHGGRKKESSSHFFLRSDFDPFSTEAKDSSRGTHEADSNTNPLKALLGFMSFDNIFGTIPAQEELRVSMVLRNNVNSEIGMGLTQEEAEENAIVIDSLRDEENPLSKMGYRAGMRVVKVNDQACPEFLSEVYAKMELRIEAEDEDNKTTRVAIIGVHEPDLDLFVHKESERAKTVYITRVEPNSALAAAGFEPGMQLTRINGRRCSGSFSELVDDLTIRIVAVPKDLIVPIGMENNKTVSDLDGSGSVKRERSGYCESRKRKSRTRELKVQRSASLLFDTKKARWIKDGLMTALR